MEMWMIVLYAFVALGFVGNALHEKANFRQALIIAAMWPLVSCLGLFVGWVRLLGGDR